MIFNNKFDIYLTNTFKKEMSSIIYYLKNTLDEKVIADRFYNNIIKNISSLSFMPERYSKINIIHNSIRNLRKMPINHYVVIYEVNNATRQVFILHIFHCNQNYLNKL